VTRNAAGWTAIKRVLTTVLTPHHQGPAAQQATPAPYPGDFHGPFDITYDPHLDGVADPGEVVWTWVRFEEDHSKGKDRPVVIVGRDGAWLLAVPMTSKDHDRDAAQEARDGRYWVDIGPGDWDRSGRPSEVRVNRIIRVDPQAIRRIATKLDQRRFAEVAAGIRGHFD